MKSARAFQVACITEDWQRELFWLHHWTMRYGKQNVYHYDNLKVSPVKITGWRKENQAIRKAALLFTG